MIGPSIIYKIFSQNDIIWELEMWQENLVAITQKKVSLPRCLLCSANEEVSFNKWENNYVCLKLHLLCTPESWHAFQLPATGRQMGKSTRLHYGAIVPRLSWLICIWLGLSEWIRITRFHFLPSPGWLWDLLKVSGHRRLCFCFWIF